MKIGSVNQSNTSWRKAPDLNYTEYLKSTTPTDRLQVITSKGEVLAKSPHYQAVKEATEVYQAFYQIPDKIPEISYKKPEETAKKDEVTLSDEYKKNNLYQLSNDKINHFYTSNLKDSKKDLGFHGIFETSKSSNIIEIKSIKFYETTSTSNPKITTYKPTTVKTGSKLDIYA